MIERILVSGFEPWERHLVNTSWLAVEALEGATILGARVKAISLPVDWESAPRLLREASDAFRPDAIVTFGMVTKGPSLWRVELVARDRGGAKGIPEGAPPGEILPSGLPVARIQGRLLEAGLDVQFSEDAGTFVCNHLFYKSMEMAHSGELPAATGFIHVPAEDTGQLQDGARLVLEAIVAPAGSLLRR